MAAAHALEYGLPPRAFQESLHFLAGQSGLHQDHLVFQLHLHTLDTWQEREGRGQQKAGTLCRAGSREERDNSSPTNLPMACDLRSMLFES